MLQQRYLCNMQGCIHNTKNIQVVWWRIKVFNKLFCMSHHSIIWGLCLLIIGSGCNQSGFTVGMDGVPNTRRANIADYEVSPAGVVLLKQFEGLRTNPYVCPGGTLTVGYGQCISQKTFDLQYPNGFSAKDAEDLLCSSLAASYVPDIKRLVKVPLDQREFDMLVSLDYSIGATVLHDPMKDRRNHGKNIRLLPLLSASCYEEAALEFPKFTKGGPERPYYRGLLKRRMTEMFVFRNGADIPEALRLPIEDDNFRKVTRCDSIAKYWEDSRQQNLRDEAMALYKAYNEQAGSSENTR